VCDGFSYNGYTQTLDRELTKKSSKEEWGKKDDYARGGGGVADGAGGKLLPLSAQLRGCNHLPDGMAGVAVAVRAFCAALAAVCCGSRIDAETLPGGVRSERASCDKYLHVAKRRAISCAGSCEGARLPASQPPPFLILFRLSVLSVHSGPCVSPRAPAAAASIAKRLLCISGLRARTFLHTRHMSLILVLSHISRPSMTFSRNFSRSLGARALSLSFQIAAMSGIQGADEVSPSMYPRIRAPYILDGAPFPRTIHKYEFQ